MAVAEECRFSAFVGNVVETAVEQRTVLPPTEQVSRGKELLHMLYKQTLAPDFLSSTSGSFRGVNEMGLEHDDGVDVDVKVIVKRTFIEVVDPRIKRMSRSQSDSRLVTGAGCKLAWASPFSHQTGEKEVKAHKPQDWSDASTDDKVHDLSDASTVCSRDASFREDPVLSDDDGVVDTMMRPSLPFQYPEIEVPEYSEYAWEFPQYSEWMSMGYDSDAVMCSPMNPMAPEFSPMGWGQQAIGSSQYQPPHVEQAASWGGSIVTQESRAQERRTTVMLRNMPNNYTREMLLELVDSMGFAASYDFAYLPIDFSSQAGLGYAFINFVSADKAQLCFDVFEGFSDWKVPSEKVCTVTWSSPYQGLEAHIERYQNSPVMHHTISDEWKPIILKQGRRVLFPPPTKAIKTPKIRQTPTANQMSTCEF
jgi:hypothetical protein